MSDWIQLYGMIAIGGAAGALTRYAFFRVLKTRPDGFAVATLTVNVLGCFLLGVTLTQSFGVTPNRITAFQAGFCGGLTTFSTFACDAVKALRNGNFKTGLSEAVLNAVLSPASLLIGSWVAQWY